MTGRPNPDADRERTAASGDPATENAANDDAVTEDVDADDRAKEDATDDSAQEGATDDSAKGDATDDSAMEGATGDSAKGDAEKDSPGGEDERGAGTRRVHIRAGVLIGVLTAIVGFAIAVQVRSNSSSDSLSNLREDDLIRILDDQNARADRLNQQIADLQRTLDELRASGNSDAVAEQQAEHEVQALQVLLGTLPATGPGVAVTITDPEHKLKAEDLLDVVEELRGAGAESLQFGPVRVGTSTSFSDTGESVSIDGQRLSAPYKVLAIGDPKTLDTALNIPGGVAAAARNAGGDAQISERQRVDITATRSVPTPKYVTSAGR